MGIMKNNIADRYKEYPFAGIPYDSDSRGMTETAPAIGEADLITCAP